VTYTDAHKDHPNEGYVNGVFFTYIIHISQITIVWQNVSKMVCEFVANKQIVNKYLTEWVYQMLYDCTVHSVKFCVC